jgi:phosphatidylglycerophosphate synthase
MFDARLQPWLRRMFDPLAAPLAARGASADAVTLAGFGFGVAASLAFCAGAFRLGLVLLLLNRFADGLDGALARRLGATRRGAFLDIALDFAVYALVPLGFAVADPARNALAAAVLLAAFIGTGSSFLAFAAVAHGKAPAFPSKGIYYLGGLTEGGETIAFFAGFALWPAAFPALASIFAALCLVTTLTRWRWGWLAFAPDVAKGGDG